MESNDKNYVKSEPNLLSDIFYYGGWLLVLFGVSQFIFEDFTLPIRLIAMGLGFMSMALSHKFQTKTLIPWGTADTKINYPILPKYHPFFVRLIRLRINAIISFKTNDWQYYENVDNRYSLKVFMGSNIVSLTVSYPELTKAIKINFIENNAENVIFTVQIEESIVGKVFKHAGDLYCKTSDFCTEHEEKIVEILNTKILEVLKFFLEKIDEQMEKKREENEFYEKEIKKTLEKILKA